MTPASRIPRWTVWAVLAGLAVTVAISIVVDTATVSAPLDRDDLAEYLLQEDDLEGLTLIGEFESVEAALDPRSGATDAVSNAFADTDVTPASAAEAARDWSAGERVVIAEVLSFDSTTDAEGYLGSMWSTYVRDALERQRGPDGSLLIFHPNFERGAGALIAPVAVAAWAVDADVIVVTYVGAGSAEDALGLARVVEHRHSGGDA